MTPWHHHHDSDARIIFCREESRSLAAGEGCSEEFDGLVCHGAGNDRVWSAVANTWIPCRYVLAQGEYVVSVAEQPVLFTHLAELGS